ncbi:NUC173-domain-containing protein [Durotheca rogersii]|uniref:NUC173-domain-containing protein n=1 Tax=Durotheca rogersii TaxID=419775 RepID=UPI00222115B8|nr:NUC173-domain-containing protein [Durotheca rogersii]KAI5863438.1 NUC173-domain-containing protein [Durotheca rogersii]
MATLEEKLDKIRSPNLQSQQQTHVILNAVEETLKEQNSQPTPTGYFAALLALLDQSLKNGQINKELTPSVVYLLDVVTPYAPQPLLRSKFTQILTLLAPVLLLEDAEAPLLRPSIGCLESLLLAQDSAAWKLPTNEISPRRAVAGLLNLALDHRPKVRKRAQDALRKVLKNPPPSPSIDHPAADLCAESAMRSLTEIANKAAASKRQKKSAAAEHDPALIHALQLVKAIAAASGGWPSRNLEVLCELLLSIAKSGNEHMTMAVFDIFEMIFEGMADELASSKLPRLLEIISEMRPSANDTQLLPPWIAILSRGYDVSAQTEPEDTFQKLPDLFTMVSEFMESSSHNIRISASECLISFTANCIPDQVIVEPSIYDEKVLEKIARIAENLLSLKYQSAWMETFNVLGAIIDALRWRANPMMLNVVRIVGEIRGNDSFMGKKEADEVLGKAIRAMGPEAVLGVLPLNLIKPVKGQPGRAWMLPILRDYTTNTNLQHFRTEFIPLSEAMFQRVLDNGDTAKTMEIKIYETVVHQTWSILPGYCDLPLDLTVAFDQSFAEMLANLLYKQVDLRLDVCRALKTLVESNQTVARSEDDENLILNSRVSKADAQKNIAYLGSFAGNLLAVLFNVYSQTLPQSRGPILQTTNAYLSITPEKELIETFDRVSTILASALNETNNDAGKDKNQKSKDHMPSTGQTLMDLVITMSAYLPRQSFGALFNIAALIIAKDDDPQLQKKAYKLIPRLAESEMGKMALRERNTELQKLILSSSEKVSAPARRERLAAITALIPFIPDTSLHFVPSVLSEVVICCKEQNEKARTLAFELLVLMGQRLADAKGKPIDNNKVPHMPKDAPSVSASIEEYLTMVSAGLAGSTPHMISASITALTRILYEFRESLNREVLSDLVQTMDLFLTSNNREIVKSDLGFVKVCVISLPTDLILPRLPTMVPNLMVWAHEHKGHFRVKVRHILERMIRRFGFDSVNRNCPEADRKLMINIRKTKERSKRRKDAAKEAGDEDGDDRQGGRRRNRFESEYDEALYSSSEGSGAEDDSDAEVLGKGSRKTQQQKGGTAYIMEDEDEPLDLLDRKALASISSTRPGRLRKAGKTKAKTDADGKLILGGDDEGEDADGDAMVIDTPATAGAEESSGVGAYVAALKSRDVGRRGRGGRLKFSNKRAGQGEGEDEMDVDEKDVSVIKTQISRGGRGGPRGGGRGRGGVFRGGYPARGGGRSGRGGIAASRRGLGQDKRRGPGPAFAGKVGKPKSPGRR